MVLLRLGPRVVGAEDLTFHRKSETSVGEIHEMITALKRREASVAPSLRLAMPKSMYWLATALITSHVSEHLSPYDRSFRLAETATQKETSLF